MTNGNHIRNVQMIGNAALMGLPKTAFLSSRKVAPQDVMRCYDWAIGVRDTDKCIMGGFQSALEKDVLRFLLRGRAPVILVLARKLWNEVPEELREPLGVGRLLVVSPVSAARVSASTAMSRNRWILENCDEIVIGSLDPNGGLAKLVGAYPSDRIVRLDKEGLEGLPPLVE